MPPVIELFRSAASRLRGIRVSSTAASLAFTTMLALVPLATVTFVVVARFPEFEQGIHVFEDWIVRVLLPGVGHGVVRDAVVGFAEQAARLTGVTLLFVAVTAALLVATIENEINLIFGVRRARPLARRVLVYAIGVSLGPVVAGISISATTWLIGQSIDAVPMHDAFAAFVGRPLPWLFAVVAFTLVYEVVPYRRVRWRHALAGGLLAATAFEAAKAGFAWYVANVSAYRQIYGALAVLPLFMLWLYVCWFIVLAGAAIVSALTPGSRAAAAG
ncbi:MAG: YihY family inner membrane protein [Betaproteobacteria bacterium]